MFPLLPQSGGLVMKAFRLLIAAVSLLFACTAPLRAEPIRPNQLQGTWAREVASTRFTISFNADAVEMKSQTPEPRYETIMHGKFSLSDGILHGVVTHITWATQTGKGEVNDLMPFACHVEMQDGVLKIKDFTLKGLTQDQEKQTCGSYVKDSTQNKR
jgi:hypothetical protein